MRTISELTTEGLEQIGQGNMKNVYLDSKSSDRIVGLYNSSRNESDALTKSRYYLVKILNILFPERIPKLHQSSKQGVVMERVRELGNFHSSKKKSAASLFGLGFSFFQHLPFIEDLESLGVHLDTAPQNFTDDNGIYLDEVESVVFDLAETKKLNLSNKPLNFSVDKLKSRILSLKGLEKKRALSALERLKHLVHQDYLQVT